MRLLETTRLEDCFDGGFVLRYRTDQPWTPDAIRSLAQLGELDYFLDFPRPYYRVRGRGGFQIRGLEGEPVCTVIFPGNGRDQLRQRWEEFILRDLG